MNSPNSARFDFSLQHDCSICLLHPHTVAARAWVEDHIGADNGYQPWFPTVVIEPRYLRDILAGIQSSGLVVR